MQAIFRNIFYVHILLQGCFAGLLTGQLITLVNYQNPPVWLSYLAVSLVLLVSVIFFNKKSIQRYILKNINLASTWFFSLVYSLLILLSLLPAFFYFEENSWIVSVLQAGSLITLCLLLVWQQLVEQGLLQKIYTGFLQICHKPYLNVLLWLPAMGAAVFLNTKPSIAIGGLPAILQTTFYLAAFLFLLLTVLKIALFRILVSGELFPDDPAARPEEGGSVFELVRKNSYYLEKNLEKALLRTAPDERPYIYEMIRQIPLVDKIEALELLHKQYLADDEGLSQTLAFLHRLRSEQPPGLNFNDIDRLGNIQVVKACIRTVIAENNPMLVQKLLSDNRPEVKKAAILATVWFRETSFIPILVNLLKEYDYAFTAKEALREWGDQCIPFLRSAKYRNKNNSFFVMQCLELAAAYKSPEARDFLVEMLNEPQKQLQYKAASALLQNNYALSALHKTQILHFTESLIAMIAVLREIRCHLQDTDSLLCIALLEEEKENKALLLDLLQAFLSRPAWYQLKKALKEPASTPAAVCALIDLWLPLVLRSKCKILLASPENENIAPALQQAYLHEQLCYQYASEQEATRQLLKLDYSQIGYWIRLCALKHLAAMPDQKASLLVLGEMFNQHPLLQEAAAEVLYTLNHDYYYLYLQRLPAEKAKVLKYKIDSHMTASRLDNNKSAINLLYGQILFLRTLPLLKDCSYEQLAAMIKLFTLETLDQTSSPIQQDPYRPVGYWIICQGSFTVFNRGECLFKARRGNVVDMSFLAESDGHGLNIRPDSEIKYLFIEKMSFNNLYLKPDYFKKVVFQPNINQPARTLAAY